MASTQCYLEVFLGARKLDPVPVKESGLSLGRAATNDVVLADPAVSDHHAHLTPAGPRFVLTDLKSLTGTTVRGAPVHTAFLAPGDQFGIGPYVIRLVTRAPGPAATAREAAAQAQDPMRTFLKGVRELSSIVGSTDLKVLLESLVERTMALFGAEKGFVVLARGRDLESVLAHHQGAPTDVTFSRTVCSMVLEQRRAVILLKPEDWTVSAFPHSLVLRRKPVGVIGLPLRDGDAILGVLYLERNSDAESAPAVDPELLRDVEELAGRSLRSARDRGEMIADRDRWRWLAASSAEETDIFRTARSESMREPLELILRAAGEPITVLIRGESGTGKEVVARTIHRLSEGRDGPFIAINCAAIPEDLVEAELFGHEAGAFTGAVSGRPGRLELAQGGTLFLDEIGDLPHDVQAKLLRVLETRTFERLGSSRVTPWNARLLAATHRDLAASAAKGTFRSDLLYRIQVVSVVLPALRDRLEDIELLTHELLLDSNRRFRRKLYGFTPEALDLLKRYPWPGNVRELKNVIERAFVLETSDRITPDSLALPRVTPATVPAVPVAGETDSTPKMEHIPRLEDFLMDQERHFLTLVLDRMGWNVTRAAAAVGLTRQWLHRRIRVLGMKRTTPGPESPDEAS